MLPVRAALALTQIALEGRRSRDQDVAGASRRAWEREWARQAEEAAAAEKASGKSVAPPEKLQIVIRPVPVPPYSRRACIVFMFCWKRNFQSSCSDLAKLCLEMIPMHKQPCYVPPVRKPPEPRSLEPVRIPPPPVLPAKGCCNGNGCCAQ
eukprot:Hpha_TRINITY_DN16199_c4_g3::TRINITY_DN16199_c4_g3_i1::g.7303::m.7303